VVPYYGWARQDRKSKPRVSIGAKLVANMLGVAGIDRVITMDLHADQEQGFFEVPVDHLFASTILLPYVKNLNLKNICIATPDVGGSKRASTYAKYLDCPMVICNKTRKRANEVDSMDVIGDVKDMDVVLVDDMVDTAGTITKAADLIKSKGARSRRGLAPHRHGRRCGRGWGRSSCRGTVLLSLGGGLGEGLGMLACRRVPPHPHGRDQDDDDDQRGHGRSSG